MSPDSPLHIRPLRMTFVMGGNSRAGSRHTIKDRNGMELTEVENIKKRWQEYIELYKKDLHDPDNHDGVITHLEPDILECEVKWALGSIYTNKASGGDEIPVELFQILKDDILVKSTFNFHIFLRISLFPTATVISNSFIPF